MWETQCFGYDGLDQLTAAWTGNDQCAAAPSAGNSSTVVDGLGAGSAYWTTWTLDTLGDRTGQTQHAFAGGPATDTATTYKYGTGTAQPHTLTSTTTTGATAGTTAYGYDSAGNMTTRNAAQGSQTISYDDAGRLTDVTGSSAGAAGYVYDVDGTVLVQKSATTVTLYVGNQQFTLNTGTGVTTGARYYALPGGGQVVRTGTTATSFSYSVLDPHGTPVLYLDSTTATSSSRLYTPYGGERGAAVAAPDNRGFLDKPTDATTGLVIVGVRNYDPATGRFITPDPLLEKDDGKQLNGYGYASNNPIGGSDPTGMRTDYYDPPSTTWVGIPAAAHQISHNLGLDKPSRSSHSNKKSNYFQHEEGRNGCRYVKGPICGHSSKQNLLQSWGCSSSRCPTPAPVSNLPPQWWDSIRKPACEGALCGHVQVTLSGCDIVCVSASYQDGHLMAGAGLGAGFGANISFGLVTARPSQQGALSAFACTSWVVGACLSSGLRGTVNDMANHFRSGGPYYGGSVSFGGGAYAGASYTMVDWHIHHGGNNSA